MNKKYFVFQTENNDCGAACLTMILKYYKKDVSLNDIKKRLKIDKEGTSAYDIINLSKKYNIESVGYKNINIDDLSFPCIAHVINNNLQHFVVVLKTLKDKVLIADPSKGIMYINNEEFNKIYTKIAIIFEKKKEKFNILKKNKFLIINFIFITLSFVILNIMISFLISRFFFNIIQNFSITKNIILISIFIILNIMKDIVFYIKNIITVKLQLVIDKDITLNIFNKLIFLPYDFFKKNSSGSIISKINDLSYIKNLYFKLIDVFFVNLILIFSCLIIISFLNIYLLLLNIVMLISLYIFNKKFYIKNYYDEYNLQIESEKLNSRIVNIISNIFNVKNLGKEKYFSNDINSKYNNFINYYKNTIKKYINKNYFISIINFLFLIISLIISILLKIDGEKIIFIYNLENIIISSANEIFELIKNYMEYIGANKRVEEIDNCDIKNNEIVKEKFENLKIDKLFYKYGNRYVLKNISFKINRGEFVMILGKSATGKSTLFKILNKQLDYSGNSIHINNKNLKKLNINQVRDNILYVEQNSNLISSDINENIFFDDDYDEKVIKTSGIDKMLLENKININYNIDNSLSNLSGGQISKILIAQALNSKRDLIIFDETTVSLDSNEEKEILKRIKKNYKDKTIILITHRKSNMNLFDKIIEIK